MDLDKTELSDASEKSSKSPEPCVQEVRATVIPPTNNRLTPHKE